MNNFISASATIQYDPKKGTKFYEDYWMLAVTSFDFIKLYNYFLKKRGIDLDVGTPFSTHISVIKGEKPKCPENWKYMDGKKIWFEYDPKPYSDNGKHVWINVYSLELCEIREKLGLPYRKKFHITIGRFYKPPKDKYFNCLSNMI